MTNEQIKQKFIEIYPDYMRGDTPLSPFFDIWESAIEIATNELQEENEKMKAILNSVAESNTYAYLLDAQKKAKYFLEE